MHLVDLKAARLAHNRRLLEEAMQKVVDLSDVRAQRAFQAAYRANIAAEETLVDLDAILDGAETK